MSELLDAMDNEKKRIAEKLAELQNRKKEIDREIATLNQELRAIEAYEKARSGVKPTRKKGSSRKSEVLKLISESEGLNRSEVLAAMNVEQGSTEANSVSNALSTLKKAGETTQDEAGTYFGT